MEVLKWRMFYEVVGLLDKIICRISSVERGEILKRKEERKSDCEA